MSTSNQPSPLLLGFMTIFSEASGYVGGYLVTNSWGRPLEFRLSTAVQPNKIQQILYADTLTEYLCADLIGKTLLDKTATPVQLLFVDTLLALPLRSRLEIPVVAVLPKESPESAQLSETDHRRLSHRCAPTPLVHEAKFETDLPTIEQLLARVDAGLDVSEPFLRIREAMGEARKMGVSRGSNQAA